MAFIYPFKGIKYKKMTPDIMSPPYDVINENYRKHLVKKNIYNIVSIILPDSYEKAKELVNKWLNNNVLQLDQECSYYLYTAEYEFNGTRKMLKGFLGALKLEPFGGRIKPHEKTLKGPKIDRFNLITKTHSMFCPIMGLYSSKNSINKIADNILNTQKPVIDAEFENIRHKIYQIRDHTDIYNIHNDLINEDIIIADGHHRYETALMIKEHFNKQDIKNGGFDYIMTLFIDSENGGLSLFPIHRLVKKIDSFDLFLDKIKQFFTVENGGKSCDFLMYSAGKFYSLTFKFKRDGDIIKKLDVSIFEKYIYQRILHLTEDDIKNQTIAGYAHSKKEVIDLVDEKKADAGFILKPMDYKDLVSIADKGLTVPQKSTFFSPKMPSGLIGYHFNSIKGCSNV